MRKDIQFWLMMLARGFVALLAGSFVLVIPDMARTLLLLPIAIAISILGLATYGVLDSVLILISSFITESRFTRAILLAQGSAGILVGVLLLSVAFDRVRLEWFLSLAAVQALSAGIGETVIAKRATTPAISRWNYTAAAIAFLAAAGYMVLRFTFASGLSPKEISWFVYGYLVALGIAQCTTAARMLYFDRKVPLSEYTPERSR